jgi:hypothetical protein
MQGFDYELVYWESMKKLIGNIMIVLILWYVYLSYNKVKNLFVYLEYLTRIFTT